MQNNTVVEIVSLLVGSSTISTLVMWLLQRRKSNAETDNVQVRTAIELVESLRKRVGELEEQTTRYCNEKEEIKAQMLNLSDTYATRISDLERGSREKDNTINALTDRVKRLEAQLVSEGLTPKP